MRQMFSYLSSFNSDISDWDVSNVTNMDMMFQYAYSFNSDLSDWDVSKVTTSWWVQILPGDWSRKGGVYWEIVLDE